MTLTRKMLDTWYAWWFQSKYTAEQAKEEILRIFSQEPDDGCERIERNIYEQSRKIISR